MSLPAPYWQSDCGKYTLYCGDCLEILPELEDGVVDAVVTDPIWPDNSVYDADPYTLFAGMVGAMPLVERMAIQLGCDSNPAILQPITMPFLRTCWLDYAVPSYKGRILWTGDVAFVYGVAPAPKRGQMIMPGKCTSTKSDKLSFRSKQRSRAFGGVVCNGAHPSPRRIQHVQWLVKWFSESAVLDPFTGSGTTGVACVKTGRRFIGIEIDESYCAIAAKRIEAEANHLFKDVLP